jgi:hypothetical protein
LYLGCSVFTFGSLFSCSMQVFTLSDMFAIRALK